MSNFFKIFSYLKPYWFYALLNIVFNVIAAFAALFSFTMVIPFLGILFDTQELVTESLPFEFTFEYLKHAFNFYLSQLIITQGKPMALMLVSIVVVIMSLLKNFFRFMSMYYTAPIRTGTVKDIRKQIFDKILKLPLSLKTLNESISLAYLPLIKSIPVQRNNYYRSWTNTGNGILLIPLWPFPH